MLAYAIRRMLVSLPILVIATFVVFVMVSLSGDPLSELKTRNPPPPPRTLQLEAHRLHLDEPFLGAAPGQAAVLYSGTRVLGGGTIA